MKAPKKLMSIVMSGAMLVGAAAPFAAPIAPAMAASGYEALQVPNVDDGGIAKLGTVFAQFTAGQLEAGDSLTITLPDDFDFSTTDWSVKDDTVTSGVYDTFGDNGNYISIPQKYSGDENGLYGNDLTIKKLDDNQIQVTIGAKQNDTGDYQGSDYALDSNDAVFYLHLDKVNVDDGFDGDIEVKLDAPSSSGFADGSVVVGRVTGGEVSVSATNVDSFSDDYDVTLRVEEDTPGALADGDESLKFTLPDGFEWGAVSLGNVLWGGDGSFDDESKLHADNPGTIAIDGVYDTGRDDENGNITADVVSFDVDEDELTVVLPDGYETSEETAFEIKATVKVADETDAETGDVTVKVDGDSDLSTSEIVIGQYGEYDATIDVDGDVPTVFSGKFDQEAADVVIKESVEGSLVDGRTVILTLPDNARWGAIDEDDDSNTGLEFAGFPGSDGKTAKWTITGTSKDAAELKLDDLEIVVEPGTEGDIVAEVSGTAGLDGELTIAKAVTPVSISVDGKPNVKIGTINDVGTITITESEAAALNDDEDLILDLPEGVKWATTPEVEVTQGDLDIAQDDVDTQEGDSTEDNQLVIPIDGQSTEASTITITGVKLAVDRTVPEGDLTVKVQGTAAVETQDSDELRDYFDYESGTAKFANSTSYDLEGSNAEPELFENSGTAAKTVIATVGTPAPEETNQNAVFTIGSTTYTVNGVDATMDVAAYTENGRTYLPARFVANALGIAPENILWDGKTATFIGNGRVVQATPGSSVLTINGSPVQMDVVAVEKDGRVMVPFRWIAQAFGAQVDYDEATQTVTMNL